MDDIRTDYEEKIEKDKVVNANIRKATGPFREFDDFGNKIVDLTVGIKRSTSIPVPQLQKSGSGNWKMT